MLKKATKKDIPTLNRLVNSAFRGDSSRKGWTTEADLLEGIRTDEKLLTDAMNEKSTTFLKYVEADNILCIVTLKNQENKLYLGMLTVAPDLQGRGIGKKLLYAAENFATKNQLPKIAETNLRLMVLSVLGIFGIALLSEGYLSDIPNPKSYHLAVVINFTSL